MRATLRWVTATALILALSGCGTPGPSSQGDRLPVVASTSVLADLVRNVGGDLVSVTSLVPKNGDVHTFAARPSDILSVARARLLIMNGLGLDDWLERTIANASADGTPLLKLGADLPGVTLLSGEDLGTQNPHLWMDVAYAQLYVDRIAAALVSVDAAHAADYERQATAYRDRLAALDAEIRAQIATVPVANRRVVMFHDAFPYYARAYGITIVGVAVPAPGQDPSAGYTSQLIDAIRTGNVRAIFSESQFPAKLVEQLAAETGAVVKANLFDDSLGDDPVTSYEALMRWDTEQLVEALK